MIRLLACVGISLALISVSINAQVPVEDIVTLAPSGQPFDDACDLQVQTHVDQVINPDASRSPFVIPAGSVFVLTGANVARSGGSGYGLDIRIRNNATVHSETVATVPLQGLFGDYGAGALMLTPGVVIGDGPSICTSVSNAGAIGAAGMSVRLYGYFAKSNKLKPSVAPVRPVVKTGTSIEPIY